jgi:hypothetical protein
MPVLDLLQGGVPFAPQAARQPCAEDLREVIGGATPNAQFAGAREEAVMGKERWKMKFRPYST